GSPKVFKGTYVLPEAAGPGGTWNVGEPNVWAIWKFSKNVPAAKESILAVANSQKEAMGASRGYNMPFLRRRYDKPMRGLGQDAKLGTLQEQDKITAFFGHPGPMTPAAQEVLTTFIVPDMFTRVARGASIDETMKWGVGRSGGSTPSTRPRNHMGHLASGGGRSPGASLSVPVGGRAKALPWWRTPSVRRYLFGYTLLAPAVLYVGVLVGAPFLFSLYLALSDASVGAPVARFVGLENFTSALETGVFWTAVRNTLVFTVGAAVMKGFLGTTLAFLLVQPFKGRRVVRGLVVIPFTIPIAISVLGWKWMFDSQFSVLNWALSGLGLIGEYGTPDWPVWLGQPMLALASVMFVNVWRSFPFSAIVLLAGMTSVSPEIIDAAKVDGATFMQRFRKIIVPMIAPILFVGAAFDTVFTLSDLSIVYLLTNGGPDGATEILPTLAYNTGIRGGALGRGAAISL